MLRSKTFLMLTVLLILIGISCHDIDLSADEKDTTNREPDRAEFMRGKLRMVQKIVEGISTEDFDLVEDGATELARLSESATWKSPNDPFYRHYSSNFEHAVRGLLNAAKSESPEKATFAYVHVTISCTACHQHVRGTKRVAR